MHVCLLTLYLSESLGARQLCSVLRARAYDCSLIFFKQFQWDVFREVTPHEEELLFSLLGQLKPRLVGISLISSLAADLAYGIADKVRARLGVPVVLGGFHPSICPEEALQHADYVCRGEGEEALTELVDALAAGSRTDSIPNIWSSVNGEIRQNDVRPLTRELDSFPFVSFGEPGTYVIEHDRVEQMDPATLLTEYHIAASRMACPFNCTYCGGPWLRRTLYADMGPHRRYRTVGHLMAEIAQARARHPGIAFIQFWDEVFGHGSPAGWLEEFRERFPREVGLPFGIWSHPGLLDEEEIVRLQGAGLTRVVMGVESGSQRVRREIFNRPETNESIIRAAELLHRLGIGARYDFIVDVPWLTEENCQGTFDLVMQLSPPFEIGIHSLSFLPRTAITERALAEGRIRPEQVARANQLLPERFESHLWKSTLSGRDRSSTFWHSMIFLAGMPFVPRPLLRKLYRWRRLLKLYPRPLIAAAEAARSKQETGRLRLHPAIMVAYPRLGAFLARHPNLGRWLNILGRRLGRLAWRAIDRTAPGW